MLQNQTPMHMKQSEGISRFKLSSVKTLVAMGVLLPGFDYYQCRLPTSDALPELRGLTSFFFLGEGTQFTNARI